MTNQQPRSITPPEPPRQFDGPMFAPLLQQVTPLIRVDQARQTFGVNGAGLTAAVLDTGLRTTHVDFAGRIPAQKNFTTDNGGNPDDATDGQGHGTNVAGIIAANQRHVGIAPGAGIIPIKVLPNNGPGSFQAIVQALEWVRDHAQQFTISAVCMSLGDSGNYQDDGFSGDQIRPVVQALKAQRIAVVVAAGNDFFVHNSVQGMSYPAIIRETISVGAVYDAFEGPFSYVSGAATSESGPDRLTPFTQRLHRRLNQRTRTDIFAPGAPVTSSGIASDTGVSVQHGTSQATPVTVGVVMLLQEFYRSSTGQLPTVHQVVSWLRRGSVVITDGDDEVDNVVNTGLRFRRIDALLALQAALKDIRKSLWLTGTMPDRLTPEVVMAASEGMPADAPRAPDGDVYAMTA